MRFLGTFEVKTEMAGGMGRAWIGKFLGYLSSHFSSSCSDAAGVVGHPSKDSFPFTTLTSLSALHAASTIIAAKPGNPLPELWALREHIHTGPRFLLSHKMRVFGRVRDTQEPGQRQSYRNVWSCYCLWNFNHNKVWQGNCACTYISA